MSDPPVDERTAAMERAAAPPVDERTAAMERAAPVDERTAAMERAAPVDERTAAMERAAPVDERTAAMERASPVDERTAAMERAAPVDERTAAMERAAPVDERTAAMERGGDATPAANDDDRARLGYEEIDESEIPNDEEAVRAATMIQSIHRGRQDRKRVAAMGSDGDGRAEGGSGDPAPAQPPVDERMAALERRAPPVDERTAAMERGGAPQPPVDPRMAALEGAIANADQQQEAEPDTRVVPVGEEGLSSPEPEEDRRIVPVGEEGILSPTPPPMERHRSRREDTRIVPVGEEDIVGLDGTPTPPPFTPTPEPISRPGSGLAHQASTLDDGTLGEETEFSDDLTDEEYDHGPSFEELYERYKEGIDERDKALAKNALLQHKIAELLAKRKQPDDRKELDAKAIADLEARYVRCLASLEELHEEMDKQQAYYDRVASEMKVRVDEREDKATLLADTFNEYKRFVFQNAQNSRTGNPIPRKVITTYEGKETNKDGAVSKERLKNISLRNQLKKLEGTLRAKEELAEGLHLIDFEQLKIENQTFNEKIEERNEELLKLRKKTTQTVQVLTHLKEKLQFVQTQNQDLKLELAELEEEVTSHRDALNKVKKMRDTFRMENVELQQHSGLVGTEELAKDFELGKVDLSTMRQTFADLKARQQDLAGKIKRVEKDKNRMVMAASRTEGVIMM